MKKYQVQQKTERRIGAGLRLALVALLLAVQIALVVGLSILLQQKMALAYMLLQVLALRYIWWQGLNPSLNFNPKQNQNYFGLAEDVTEAYNPLVEKLVYEIFTRDNLENNQPLTAEYKAELLQLLNKSYYDGKRLISLFELVRKTVAEASASLRQNKVRLAFSNYLIEVKEM